jgi:hypothetical protein
MNAEDDGEHAAMDQKLNDLVAKMNSARGQAKSRPSHSGEDGGAAHVMHDQMTAMRLR